MKRRKEKEIILLLKKKEKKRLSFSPFSPSFSFFFHASSPGLSQSFFRSSRWSSKS